MYALIFQQTSTATRIGAHGLFTVLEAQDEDGNDITRSLQAGDIFFDEDALLSHVAKLFRLSEDDVDLQYDVELG